MKQQMMAMASAGPYTNHLHLAPDRQPRQHLITQFFTGRMLFLTPNQHCQSTKATIDANEKPKLECGPMPNMMAALPNIGGALCSMLQSLADAHY